MKSKRTLGIILLGASMAGASLFAAPLREAHVAKGAQWLVHVDVEALMESDLGDVAVQRLKEEVARRNESKLSVDVEMVLNELKSITTYGMDFSRNGELDGVIVLETGDKLPAIIDGFLAHEALANDGETNFELLDDKPYTTYLFDDELYVAYPREGLIMASKRFDRIEQAFEVAEGTAPNVGASDEPLVLNNSSGFFFVATANGLSELKDMPPQARILQKTTGGQLSVGQFGGDLRANMVLGTSGSQVSQQLFRIVQGMIALVSFAQVENEGLAGLMQSVDVSQGDKFVAIDFAYPVAELMGYIEAAMASEPCGEDCQEEAHGHPWHESAEKEGQTSVDHSDRAGAGS